MTAAERLGSRQLAGLRDELSGRDHATVGQVAELRLMSARQIEAIHFPLSEHASALSAARGCRRVLERLVRDRLLVRLERRIGGIRAGSASFVYALGPVGHRLVAADGARPRLREPSASFVAHTLAIGDVVVVVTEAARAGRLELLGLQTEPRCWRTFTGSAGEPTVLRPDLYVSVGAQEFEHRWFVEVDLGTEHLPTLLGKCQAYEAYYRSGTEQAQHGVFPKVLWLMHDDRRTASLSSAIRRSSKFTDDLFQTATPEALLRVLTGGGS